MEEMQDLETRLATYLTIHNLTEIRIPGLKAILTGSEVITEETPLTNEKQLNLLGDYFCLEYKRRA